MFNFFFQNIFNNFLQNLFPNIFSLVRVKVEHKYNYISDRIRKNTTIFFKDLSQNQSHHANHFVFNIFDNFLSIKS